ncbi:MAG: F0F1 ATP synthase subunit B [Cardiobacteriaceae bacterium]|nr:F0F1 ATP synthase subunit B [Cardiobacteriaceae bacterium]
MNLNLTLIGQMGTFLVFWWFVNKYVWPIFARVAKERQQKIAEGLSVADKAKHALFAAEEESAELLSQARSQAGDILSRAHKQADQMIEEARQQAKEAGALELSRAREQIEQEKLRVVGDLRKQLAALVIQGAEQVVGREIKAGDHDALLRELSEKL